MVLAVLHCAVRTTSSPRRASSPCSPCAGDPTDASSGRMRMCREGQRKQLVWAKLPVLQSCAHIHPRHLDTIGGESPWSRSQSSALTLYLPSTMRSRAAEATPLSESHSAWTMLCSARLAWSPRRYLPGSTTTFCVAAPKLPHTWTATSITARAQTQRRGWMLASSGMSNVQW